MQNSNIIRVALLATVALGLSLPAVAKRSEEQRAAHQAEKAAKHEERVRQKLAPALQLDEGQTERLIAAMREVKAERRAAKHAVRAEREQLQALIDQGASDGALVQQMTQLERAAEAAPKHSALLDETRRFLTPLQQAKLTVMLPKVAKHHGRDGKHGKRGKHGKLGKRAHSQVDASAL